MRQCNCHGLARHALERDLARVRRSPSAEAHMKAGGARARSPSYSSSISVPRSFTAPAGRSVNYKRSVKESARCHLAGWLGARRAQRRRSAPTRPMEPVITRTLTETQKLAPAAAPKCHRDSEMARLCQDVGSARSGDVLTHRNWTHSGQVDGISDARRAAVK